MLAQIFHLGMFRTVAAKQVVHVRDIPFLRENFLLRYLMEICLSVV